MTKYTCIIFMFALTGVNVLCATKYDKHNQIKTKWESRDSKVKNNETTAKVLAKNEPIIDHYLQKNYIKVVELYEANRDYFQPKDDLLIFIGIAYREIGDNENSIKILEKINSNQPNLNKKAQFEKMLSCYKAKDFNCALEIINFLLKQETANDNQIYFKNIQKKIEQESNAQNKIFYGSIGLSYLYDTNPNFTSGLSSLKLYGLTQSSGIESDMGLMTSLNLGYNYKINRNWSLFGAGNLSYTYYSKIQDRDISKIYFYQGLGYNYNKWNFSILGSYNNAYFGRDTLFINSFYRMYGISPSISYSFNDKVLARLAFNYDNKKMYMLLGRDSDMFTASFMFYIAPLQYTSFFIGGSGGMEFAQVEYYTNYLYSGFIGIRQYLFNLPIFIDARYSYNQMHFLKANPYFNNIIRADSSHSAIASIHFMLNKYIDIYIQYVYTDNKSTVDLYVFERHQIMAGFRLFF